MCFLLPLLARFLSRYLDPTPLCCLHSPYPPTLPLASCLGCHLRSGSGALSSAPLFEDLRKGSQSQERKEG